MLRCGRMDSAVSFATTHRAHSNAYKDSRLRLVAVDKQAEVVIVDVEVGAEVASQGNRSDQFAQPPHNVRACAWVWRNDEDRLGQH